MFGRVLLNRGGEGGGNMGALIIPYSNQRIMGAKTLF